MIRAKRTDDLHHTEWRMEVDGVMVGPAFPSLRHLSFFSNWLEAAQKDGLVISVPKQTEEPAPAEEVKPKRRKIKDSPQA